MCSLHCQKSCNCCVFHTAWLCALLFNGSWTFRFIIIIPRAFLQAISFGIIQINKLPPNK